MKHIGLTLVLTLMGIVQSCAFITFGLRGLPDVRDGKVFDAHIVRAADEKFEFFESNRTEELGKTLLVNKSKYATETISLDEGLKRSATLGFMIIRNDSILYERYFKGYDETDNVASFSVAKTFVGALTAIAREEGHIKSFNDPICIYLPELDAKLFQSVTIQHLLDHTSGIKFPPVYQEYYGNNLAKTMIDVKPGEAPGTRFFYDNGNTQLLAMLLEKATGQTIDKYLEAKIWSRIGTEADLHWNIDSRRNHTIKAFCCMNARMRDFAKFGRLLLNEGNWNGTQIIPKAWFAETRDRNTAQGRHIIYKNHIWSERHGQNILYAAGLYNQYLYLYPDKNIIIVKFSRKNLTRHPLWSDFFGMLIDQL